MSSFVLCLLSLVLASISRWYHSYQLLSLKLPRGAIWQKITLVGFFEIHYCFQWECSCCTVVKNKCVGIHLFESRYLELHVPSKVLTAFSRSATVLWKLKVLVDGASASWQLSDISKARPVASPSKTNQVLCTVKARVHLSRSGGHICIQHLINSRSHLLTKIN